MRKLALAMEHAVRGVAKDCSHESFEKSFPQLARDNPKALAEARDAAVAHFEQSAMDVFQQLVAQRGVDVKLDELDALTEAVAHMPKQEVDRDRPAPIAAIIAQRYKIKKMELERLIYKLKELTGRNDVQQRRILEKQEALRKTIMQCREARVALLPPPPLGFGPEGQMVRLA